VLAEAELVEPALVLELPPLLLLLLQAARTPTESATALVVMTFLENQGKVNLTPGSSFLLGQGCSGSSPPTHRRAHFRGLYRLIQFSVR
jgi:hypothetical protein